MKPTLFLLLCLTTLAQAAVYHPEVLEKIASQIQTETDFGTKPVVVFDLDDTLFRSNSRTLKILKELTSETELQNSFSKELEAVRTLETSQIHYELMDTLSWIGIKNPTFIEVAVKYWAPRYFSNAYVVVDRPLYRAVEYVNDLHDKGAYIVYLTGRDIPRMEYGTRLSLSEHGFPMDADTRLMMKPSKELEDLKFKQDAFESISKTGKVVAGFENEPANLNAFKKAWPEAQMVFIDSIHSNKPDVPESSAAWIKNFRY